MGSAATFTRCSEAAGLAGCLILTPHTKAAVSCFRSGLAAVVLFSVAVWLQPVERVAKAVNIAGMLAAVAYAAFLVIVTISQARGELQQELDPEHLPERPGVWVLPVVEWAAFVSTMVWFFCLALGIR